MPKITYRQSDGSARELQVRTGVSLVEAALRFGFPGIEAKSRGNCACVTCHVHIDPIWRPQIGEPGPMEASMLDFAEGVEVTSRLGCQVRVTEGCEGMEVLVPGAQRVLGL